MVNKKIRNLSTENKSKKFSRSKNTIGKHEKLNFLLKIEIAI